MALLGLVEDVTDVVEEAISLYGNIMPGLNAEKFGKIDGKWMAVPFLGAVSAGTFIRGDKLAEAGIDPATLTTFDARRDAALAISDPDNEFWGWGVTPNQSGDGYGFLVLLIQAFGGSFTDESGMKVIFNSPETVAAFEWLAETYDRNGKYAADAAAGNRELGRHLEQRGVSRRQDRLHPQRLLGLCAGEARPESGLPEYHPHDPAGRQQRRQPRRRGGAADG